jgi:hypothetical protein
MTHIKVMKLAILAAAIAGALLLSQAASAHCDALDGPVVGDARLALERKSSDPVLKWVRAEDEGEVREAFRRAQAVRARGREARDLAERWFFETVVRLHRAGEGEPFTGLKPAGQIDPGLAAADAALASGDVAPFAADLAADVAEGIARRHALVLERRAHVDDTLAAGRAYVEAYVDYAHFVEAAHALRSADPHHAGHAAH